MPSYEKFAQVYDKMGSDDFSIKMFKYSQRILTGLRYRPKSVLDLACGTGTAAVMWAKKNIETFGIDGSAHMLETAKRKARAEKVSLTLSKQPLTAFSLPKQVDLVSCYFDSLNYLLNINDLTAAFRSARRVLHDDGYFIFDVNTPEAMKTLWDNQTYADENEDLAWIWKNVYFPRAKQAEVQATFFVRQGKVWERFDETHAERGYGPREVKSALKSAGFKTVNIYDCLTFKKPNRKTVRIAVVAKKES